MAKTTTKKAAAKPAAKTTATAEPKRVVSTAERTPEAKVSPKAQQDAAAKMFKDADQAALTGLPPEMTVEQHENHVRRAALGY